MTSSKLSPTDEERSDADSIDLISKYSIQLYPSSPKKKTRDAADNDSEDTVELTTMDQWYDFYATRYPSRGYLERQQRSLQLQQEKQTQNELLKREKRKQQGGFFRRLFFGGGGGEGDDNVNSAINNEDNQDKNGDAGDDYFFDESENKDLLKNTQDDEMCGTTSSLDQNAITKEALALHRFHLVSERRAMCAKDPRRLNKWHVVLPIRNCVGYDDNKDSTENMKKINYCIVGYGKIAEFPALPSPSDPEQLNGAKVALTSDRTALCQFIKDKKYDSLSDLRHTRAALIGPDCLVVSWGRGDGLVVVYRRVQQQKGSKKVRILEVGWMAVAVIAPTDAVTNEALKSKTPIRLSTSGDHEKDDSPKQRQEEIASLFEAGPLRVTDLMPMVVECSMSATLAISRLGGYIELIHIPNQIWSPYSRPPIPPLNQLTNLNGVGVTTISTDRNHIDIMALDAYRTDSEWNGDRESEFHPAEFVLASCGCSDDSGVDADEEGIHGGKAVVTLWSVTTADSKPQRDGRDMNDDLNSNVRIREINSITIGQLGADSTVFISSVTSNHWVDGVSGTLPDRSRKRKKASCSITTNAPFTSLRFTPRKSVDIFLAALDYNGGVTVIDTTEAVAFAEHRKSQAEVDSSNQLLRVVSNRDFSLSTSSRKSRDAIFTSQIEWWCPSRSRTLHLAFFSLRRNHRNAKSAAMNSFIQLHNFVPRAGLSNNIKISVRKRIASSIMLNGGTVLLPITHHPLNETLSFVHFSGSQQKTQLSICGIRSILDPNQLITLLLERSDPESALFVAQQFGGADHFGGNVVNECRMKLWEEQMDFRALKLVLDDQYVIDEAMKLMCLNLHDNNATLDSFSLDSLLEVYREGLYRCERRFSAGAGVDNDWATQFRNSILCLGTFQLLFNHFKTRSVHDESIIERLSQRFLNFQRKTVFEVAECAATSCDIGALTIIFARHRIPLHIRMNILDRIPLSMDLTLFQHLLPCHCDSDRIEGSYLPSIQPRIFMTALEFFSHLADAQMHGQQVGKVDVFTDNADRENIVEIFSNDNTNLDENRHVSKDFVAFWYLKRAIGLHKETGHFDFLRKACQLGLLRLGLFAFNDISLHGLTEVSGKLFYLHLAAQLLGYISGDKLRELLSLHDRPFEILSSASTLFRSVLQFCSMGIADIVSYISQSDDIFNSSMFDKHVKSFMSSDQYFQPDFLPAATNADVLSDKVGSDVANMCISKIMSVRNSDRSESFEICSRLESALYACLYCASLGSNSIPSIIRIIHHEDDLVDFVENAFRSTIIVINDDWDLITERLLHILWSIFELLPSDGLFSDQVMETGNRAVGLLYFKLVSLQLCCKWRRHGAFPCVLKSFFRSPSNGKVVVTSNEACISSAGYDVIAYVCRSFSDQATEDVDETLLFNFASDIEELDQRFFSGTIQASGFLGHLLVPSLLKQESFDVLRGILKLLQKWLDEDYVMGVVQSFVEDQINSGSSIHGSESAASAALACMECLGPFFPDLREEFERRCRLLDAKNYISETMNLKLDTICNIFDDGSNNSTDSLVIVESLVRECPRALLFGCEFWGDIHCSKNACIDASTHFSFQINAIMSGNPITDSTTLTLPPMPGGLVMRFANILGINTSFKTLVVKKIMLMGAVRMSILHAAVAICYSMLADAAVADDYTGRHKSELFSCINTILLDQTLTNIDIKKGLCVQTLMLFSTTSFPPFDVMLNAFYNLEYVSHREPSHDGFNGSLSRLFREIKQSTSIDVLLLLSSLRLGVTSKQSNLEVVCRTVLNWISSESFLESALSYYNMLDLIELVSFCLNELDDDTALTIIDRTLEAFEATGLQRNHSHKTKEQIQPDQSIVNKLIGRGYGGNASRRAAIMTKNQGYSEALSWAVSHFQDDNFNSPLYFLQVENVPQQLEQGSIENIKRVLVAMQTSRRQPATNTLPLFPAARAHLCSSPKNAKNIGVNDGGTTEECKPASNHVTQRKSVLGTQQLSLDERKKL
jgi:hypothetical protein